MEVGFNDPPNPNPAQPPPQPPQSFHTANQTEQTYLTTNSILDSPNNKAFEDFLAEYYSNYTEAALVDEVLKYFLTSETNGRFYYAQAEYYIRRINVSNPLPIFVLYPKDIPEALNKELDRLGKKAKDTILTDVVRRIYEAVDPDYFAVNGIWAKVRYHLLIEENEEARTQ